MPTNQLAILCWLCHFAVSSAVDRGLGMQQITPTPVIHGRGAFQTAGFISGNPDSPITCPGTSTVSKGPEYAFGCCDSATCWKPASCQTNGQPTCGPNCVYSQITRCTDEASPSCAQYVLKTGVDDTDPYTSFLCLPEATEILVLATATGGGGGSGGGSSTPATSSGSPTTTGSSSPADTSAPSPDAGGGGGGLTEDQKIALGVGIGVGVPALIVALLTFLYPRHSRW